jgi:hypothetical protein
MNRLRRVGSAQATAPLSAGLSVRLGSTSHHHPLFLITLMPGKCKVPAVCNCSAAFLYRLCLSASNSEHFAR